MRSVRNAVIAWVRRRAFPRRRTAAGTRPRGRIAVARAAERALVAFGVACLAWCAAAAARAAFASARADRRLDRMRADAPGPTPGVGDPLGRIAIPSVGLNDVIVEGDDDLTLSFAAGHIPGTALFGARGNTALAGHRDGVFAALARIRTGDAVMIRTPGARYRYVVRSVGVVAPDATSLLGPTPRPTLTLVTCYPFRYVGPAPLRYVVRAELVAAAPVAPAAGRTAPARPNA